MGARGGVGMGSVGALLRGLVRSLLKLVLLVSLAVQHGRCEGREVGAWGGVFWKHIELRCTGWGHHGGEGDRVILPQTVSLFENGTLLRVHCGLLVHECAGLAMHIVAVGRGWHMRVRRVRGLSLEVEVLRVGEVGGVRRCLVSCFGSVGVAGRHPAVVRHGVLHALRDGEGCLPEIVRRRARHGRCLAHVLKGSCGMCSMLLLLLLLLLRLIAV